jgi:Lecithin:cholesterol acyltransferase
MPKSTSDTTKGPPKHFVVIVPGYMGSRLRSKKSGKIAWIDFPSLLKNPLKIGDAIDEMLESMAYPNDDLEPAGIMNQVLVVPPFAKQEHYGRLLKHLEEWGYQIDPDNPQEDDLCAYTFAYDWRQDNRISAEQLGSKIEEWRSHHPDAEAWLIAHSNGGILSRWYIQKCGGKDYVGRLFLMGSPWDGAPKAIKVMNDGLDVLGLKRFNLWNLGKRMKDLIRSFPSFYQLVPVDNPFLRSEDNIDLDLFGDPSWLDKDQDRKYLMDAYQFNKDLAGDPGVDTICFYGTRKPTTTAGVVRLGAGGRWEEIQWIETGAGDGTVPERSAKHPWFEAQSRDRWRPFPVGHGDIYVDEGVLAFLRQELVDKYKGKKRAALYTPEYSILFNPDRDFYTPNEDLMAWAEIKDTKGKPVSKATVKARLSFREPLPGSEGTVAPAESEEVRLRERKENSGRYEAILKVPDVEGYYRLSASIKLVGKPTVTLEELVAVEQDY